MNLNAHLRLRLRLRKCSSVQTVDSLKSNPQEVVCGSLLTVGQAVTLSASAKAQICATLHQNIKMAFLLADCFYDGHI
jgi:ribosomal protein RSM22 (predicted rRNA methylase)